MRISFLGKSDEAIRLSDIFKKSNITISAIFDISIQKTVEFASYTDSKAYLNIHEAIECSDLIFITDNDELKSYTTHILKENPKNKIFCLISSKNTSDKIYTNETNTHFSIYSPHLFSNNELLLQKPHFIYEGFGIMRTDFVDFLSSNNINSDEITIDNAKKFYSVINLFTNGLETLCSILQDEFSKISIVNSQIINDIIQTSLSSPDFKGSFFTYDTHSVIKTMDSLKAQNKNSILSLYKILGLNAMEYASYNKDEKEHFTKIILDKMF